MINKRGQGLSTNAIILIVLGVVVLVVLIIGFTMGWDRIAPWTGAGNNVESIVTQCNVACSTANTYDFCVKTRTLKADDLPDIPPAAGAAPTKIKAKKATGSCNDIVAETQLAAYGIEGCPTLTCDKTNTVVFE